MSTSVSKHAMEVSAYRRRLAESGAQEVLLQLPNETVEMLDSLKQSRGLRSRSAALLELIKQGRTASQQISS